MNISNITPPQVWTASSRSLTNFGSGALAATATIATTVAAAASIDLRTSAGTVGMTTIAVITGGAATAAIIIQQTDGTSPIQIVSTAAAANSSATLTAVNGPSVGQRIHNNDGVNAGTYNQTSFIYTI